eukprot:3653903-Alexandrium_andersonii.AAC.1
MQPGMRLYAKGECTHSRTRRMPVKPEGSRSALPARYEERACDTCITGATACRSNRWSQQGHQRAWK